MPKLSRAQQLGALLALSLLLALAVYRLAAL